ncbi:hypothetical protein M0812_14099 [Anaeramoeba flamelloides]|uniref:5'-deoxynucleotidase n=1 Tax=Anaeramoeba flamelloides TaxID=1746091 RepID=A0AAV7ZEH9_9EUKA|nr:hypothetical protein M0812_14099 [Anaeramoeba flamelloides]
MENHTNQIFEFLSLSSQLKHLPRTGWVRSGITSPESVAGHSWRTALLVLFFPSIPNKFDQNKALRMALVHDIGESIVGDFTPTDLDPETKYEKEKKAYETLEKTEGGQVGQDIKELWLEFEAGKTEEAKLVKQLDKFEMLKQAFEYEKRSKKEIRLKSFFKKRMNFENTIIEQWHTELLKQRDLFWETKTIEEKN